MEEQNLSNQSNQTNPTGPTLVDMQRFQKKNSGNDKKILIVLILFAIISAAAYCFFFLDKKSAEPVAPGNNSNVSKTENVIDKTTDTDNDGLPDYMEKVLGIDANNPDSDGDGYMDFDEIKNGYDPLSDKKYTEEEWQAVKDKIKAADEGFYEEVFGKEENNINDAQKAELIKIARDYFQENIAIKDEINKINFNSSWFLVNNPDDIWYNPLGKFEEARAYFNDKYIVYWLIMPGCERNIESKNKPNWFNKQGIQCLGGYAVDVIINTDLKVEKVEINAVG